MIFNQFAISFGYGLILYLILPAIALILLGYFHQEIAVIPTAFIQTVGFFITKILLTMPSPDNSRILTGLEDGLRDMSGIFVLIQFALSICNSQSAISSSQRQIGTHPGGQTACDCGWA